MECNVIKSSRRIGVGDEGGRGHVPPKIREKYFFSGNYCIKFGHFSGKNHVKFGHFVNFSDKFFGQKCISPRKAD